MTKNKGDFNALPNTDSQSHHQTEIPSAELVNDNDFEQEQDLAFEIGGQDSGLNYPCSAAERDGKYEVSDKSFMMKFVKIIAPANLNEGYKFNASFNGELFPVIVPAGGCIKGQVLVVPFNPHATSATPNQWNDGLFACTRYGLTHPSFLCACCCPLILLGQVMTRLKMDWTGRVSDRDEWIKTFRTFLLIGTFKFVLFEEVNHPFEGILSTIYVCFLLYLLVKVRKHVRHRDGISNETPFGAFEDCAVSYCCTCCTISQLARQTANYDIETGLFLSQDGLDPYAPSSHIENVMSDPGSEII